jgi:hypothetical protein
MCGCESWATGARLAAEALELVGVRRDLAVHQLDRDRRSSVASNAR